MTMKNILPTYNQAKIDFIDGKDWHLTDSNHKTYLDLTSGIGVNNLGYSNELVQKNVKTQVDKIWHVTNLYQNHLEDEVAGLLSPEGMLAFFCNSGTEANEAAFKLARRYTKKPNILAFNHGFHGRTYGSMSLTGNPQIKNGFWPMVPNTYFANYNDFAAIDKINSQYAAVILEVVQGEGGVNVGNGKWLKAVEEKCHQENVLLIIDEVQTGMGRTGTKFAYQQLDLNPDIVTSAKALANGLPVGAMMAKKELADAFGPGSHGNTFGGNKIVMASAKAVLEQLTPKLLDQVQAKSKAAFKKLNQEILPLNAVTKINGIGMMMGIRLNPGLKVTNVVSELQAQGVLTLVAGQNTLRLLPPLVIDEDDLLNGIEKIKQTLAKLDVDEVSESE